MIPLLLVPLVQQLMSKGLGTLANAVIAKGKDVIEEKLGVDLEKEAQTEDGLYRLKQLEVQHEEFLLTNALQNKELDLKFYEADAKDRNSAREMETKIQESEHASWLAKNVVPILALIVVIGGGAGVVFSPDADVRLGLTSIITLVLGFYFGTSNSSKQNGDAIRAIAQKGVQQ